VLKSGGEKIAGADGNPQCNHAFTGAAGIVLVNGKAISYQSRF
jgi:hypothetical protein